MFSTEGAARVLSLMVMAVALHVAADDGAVEHVQGREQGGGAMALVVVGMVPARPLL